MADSRRGKKQNHDKNFGSANDFAKGKKIGRPKQQWVVDEFMTAPDGSEITVRGHWEKVNVQQA